MQNSTLGIHGQFADIHICGACKAQFSDIQAFVVHKQQSCSSLLLPNLNILVPDPVNQNTIDGAGGALTSHHELGTTEQSLISSVKLSQKNSFSDSASLGQNNHGVAERSQPYLRTSFGKHSSTSKCPRPTATVQPQRQKDSHSLQGSSLLSSENKKQLNSEPNASSLCTSFPSDVDFSVSHNSHVVQGNSLLAAQNGRSEQIHSGISLPHTVANPQSLPHTVANPQSLPHTVANPQSLPPQTVANPQSLQPSTMQSSLPFQTNLIFAPSSDSSVCQTTVSLPPSGSTAEISQSCISFPAHISTGSSSQQHCNDALAPLNVGNNASHQASSTPQTFYRIRSDTTDTIHTSDETCSQDLIMAVPSSPVNNDMFTPATDSPDFFVTNELNVAVPAKGPVETAENRDTESPGITIINEFRMSKSQIKYQIIKKDGTKRYKCEFESCNYTTPYRKDLDRHFRTHTGERPFLCQKCGKAFNRMDKVRAHERCHTGVRPYKCRFCSYATNDNSSLVKHLRIHTDERPFKCQMCPYASRSTSQLVVHLRTHTGDAPFHCFVCSAKFKINSDLKRHVRQHTGEKPFKCTICNYQCSVKVNLTVHNRLNHSIEDQWKCSKCDFSSPSRKKLREHERSHNNKPLSCPQCTFSTASKRTLKTHLQLHSGEKPYKCNYCPYTSRQTGNLQTHIKTKHPDKAVKRKKTTKGNSKHEEEENVDDPTHKPESRGKRKKKSNKASKPACQKTYKCTLCDDSFVREDSLRSHIRHHMKQPCEPAALAMLQLQDSMGNPSAPQNSSTVSETSRNFETPEVSDVAPSSSTCQNQQSATVNTIAQPDNRDIQSPLPLVNSSLANDCSNVTSASCALISEINTFSSAGGLTPSTFVDTHSQNVVTDDRNFSPSTSSDLLLQPFSGASNEISNIHEESQLVLNRSVPTSVVSDSFDPQVLVQEQPINENHLPHVSQGGFDLGANSEPQVSSYLPTPVASSVCSEVSPLPSTSHSQQGSSTISRTEAATLLARIQNHTNLAREDNLHNASIANNSLPPDLVAVPISSLLPITTTTQSQTVSLVPPVQVSSPIQTTVVPSSNTTCSAGSSSTQQPAENAPQLMYPVQQGLRIIAIPIVPLNHEAVKAESVVNDVSKMPISTTSSQNGVMPLPQPAAFITPPPPALVQFSGLQSNVQYILQPPPPPQPPAIRLEVAGIQLSLGNNTMINSCPEPTVPQPAIPSLTTSRVLTAAPSNGMGDLTFLLMGNNSTDTSQNLNNLSVPMMADNTLNGTIMPAQSTVSKIVLGAVPGLSTRTNSVFNTSTQISQETLNNVVYPSWASSSGATGETVLNKPSIPVMVSPVYSMPETSSSSALSGQGSSQQQQ